MPQQMKTMAARRIQIQLVTVPSVSEGMAKQMMATKASTMPRMPSLETFSLRKVADRSTVTMGATEIMGMTRYEGAYLSARNSTSWPPAPRRPTPMLSAADLGRTSSFQLILNSAKSAQGIIDRAQTT